MLLVDYSAVAIAAFFAESDGEIHEGLLRHMIYNSLRNINKMYKEKYGWMILCCDNSSWRKAKYSWYKANRAKGREESTIDWTTFYELIRQISKDLNAGTHFGRISLHECEADDIIAELALNSANDDEVMIISGDKDFKQLQIHPGISQYSPIVQKHINLSKEEALEFLADQLIRGDSSDGVPNILSPSNILTMTDEEKAAAGIKRQKSITKKFLSQAMGPIIKFIDGNADEDDLLEDAFDGDKEILKRFLENNDVINLNEIPKHLGETILKVHDAELDSMKERKIDIIDFLIKSKCNKLVEVVDDFRVNQKETYKIYE